MGRAVDVHPWTSSLTDVGPPGAPLPTLRSDLAFYPDQLAIGLTIASLLWLAVFVVARLYVLVVAGDGEDEPVVGPPPDPAWTARYADVAHHLPRWEDDDR